MRRGYDDDCWMLIDFVMSEAEGQFFFIFFQFLKVLSTTFFGLLPILLLRELGWAESRPWSR